MKQTLKSLLLSLLVLYPLPSSSEFLFPLNKAPEIVTLTLEKFTSHYSANDYSCGSVSVSVQPGWEIVKAKIKNGTLLNQFQFSRSVSNVNLFHSNRYSTNQLQVKQTTGYFALGNIYWGGNPVDFIVYTRHLDSGLHFNFHITKRVCSTTQVGEVTVLQIDSDTSIPVTPYIRNPERNDLTYFYHHFSSAFFTPAYVLIPSPENPPEFRN